MPYLATFLNCGLWVLYGLPMVHTNSILVVTINGTGFVIEVIYLWLFLIYFDRKKRRWPVLILAAECLFMAVLALLVLTLAHLTKLHSAIVGNICMVGNIMMYASPSAVMVSLLHLFFLENRWPLDYELGAGAARKSLSLILYSLILSFLCLGTKRILQVLDFETQIKWNIFCLKKGLLTVSRVHFSNDLRFFFPVQIL